MKATTTTKCQPVVIKVLGTGYLMETHDWKQGDTTVHYHSPELGTYHHTVRHTCAKCGEVKEVTEANNYSGD